MAAFHYVPPIFVCGWLIRQNDDALERRGALRDKDAIDSLHMLNGLYSKRPRALHVACDNRFSAFFRWGCSAPPARRCAFVIGQATKNKIIYAVISGERAFVMLLIYFARLKDTRFMSRQDERDLLVAFTIQSLGYRALVPRRHICFIGDDTIRPQVRARPLMIYTAAGRMARIWHSLPAILGSLVRRRCRDIRDVGYCDWWILILTHSEDYAWYIIDMASPRRSTRPRTALSRYTPRA